MDATGESRIAPFAGVVAPLGPVGRTQMGNPGSHDDRSKGKREDCRASACRLGPPHSGGVRNFGMQGAFPMLHPAPNLLGRREVRKGVELNACDMLAQSV